MATGLAGPPDQTASAALLLDRLRKVFALSLLHRLKAAFAPTATLQTVDVVLAALKFANLRFVYHAQVPAAPAEPAFVVPQMGSSSRS